MTALVGNMAALFLGSIFMTLTATAIPRIVTDLGGFSQYTWVQTAYIITESISLPLSGKLSDLFGRKWVLIIGMMVFVLGTLLCGFAQSMNQLIVFRAVQGFGFGAMNALGFIIIADLFPPEERGKYSGIMAGVFGVATVIGPTLGGIITDALSWRWVFWITVPIGLVIIVLFIFMFPRLNASREKPRIDYMGVITMACIIVPLMLGLSWGGINYAWASPVIIGLFVLSAVALVAFIYVEKRAAEPIIPMTLFRNRIVSVATTVAFFQGLAFFPVMTFIPLYFQGVLGASAARSGGFMTPMMLSMALGSFIGGVILSRTGGRYRVQSTVAFGIMCIGLFLMTGMSTQTAFWAAIVYISLTGFGSGNIMPVHTIAVQNNVPYHQLGSATSLITLIRPLGGVVGLAIVGSILNNRFASQFLASLPTAVREAVSGEQLAGIVENPQAIISPDAYDRLQAMFQGMGDQGAVLFDQLIVTLREALNSALSQMFLVFLIAGVIGLILNFWLKDAPLTPASPAEMDNPVEEKSPAAS